MEKYIQEKKYKKYMLIELKSKEILSLQEKKEYINKMYSQRVKIEKNGLIHQFNNAIGYKNVNNYDYNSKTNLFTTPKDLLYKSLRNPIEGLNILEFYIPRKTYKHKTEDIHYFSFEIGLKFSKFLQKVFPQLDVIVSFVEEKPFISVKEHVLQNFIRSIDKTINYNIETSIPEKLNSKELDYILSYLVQLTDFTIGINQFHCISCAEGSLFENPIHIEIEYLLQWYESEKRNKEELEFWKNNIKNGKTYILF